MIIYHSKFLSQLQPLYHPESPLRLKAVVKELEERDLFNNIHEPSKASIEELATTHSLEYINFIKNFGEGYLSPDTYLNNDTFETAAYAAGGAIHAAKLSYEESKPSFALLRPPGHHAAFDSGGGFCYFNNIAVSANCLLDRADRIAILDIDGHHGNGTQDIFSKNNKILYISTHQWGIYPGTGLAEYVGEGKGRGYTVNIPFISGCGDSSYNLAFNEIIEPILTQFKPKFILVSVGVDAHYKDLMTSLSLSSPGYFSLLKKMMNLARTLCNRRISFMLEGGYHLPSLSEVIAAVIASFEGKEVGLQFVTEYDTSFKGKGIVEKVKTVQGSYWEL